MQSQWELRAMVFGLHLNDFFFVWFLKVLERNIFMIEIAHAVFEKHTDGK